MDVCYLYESGLKKILKAVKTRPMLQTITLTNKIFEVHENQEKKQPK
jgi:hypothetical protein